MLVLLRSVYECVSIFLAGDAGGEFVLEEAFLVVLQAEKAEMVIFVRLSPHLQYSTHFMFVAEL
jgi:hypothetical protein